MITCVNGVDFKLHELVSKQLHISKAEEKKEEQKGEETKEEVKEEVQEVQQKKKSLGPLPRGEVSETEAEWRKQVILNGHPSAWIGHEDFAWFLCDWLKPKTIVDLGVDWGYSTFVFAAAKQGKVYGIDHFTGDPHTGQRDTLSHVTYVVSLLRGAGCNIEIMKADFTQAAKDWNRGPIQLMHLDGFHEYQQAKSDFTNWLPHLDKEMGVLICHDTSSFPSVLAVFDEAPKDLFKVRFLHSAGLGVLSYNRELIETISRKYALPMY